MMDRRLYRCNGRVAHSSLIGTVNDVPFCDGEARSITAPVANLHAAPDGALDRQLIHGDGFSVLEDREGWSFGYAEPSGYVGYVLSCELGMPATVTHKVATIGAHVYPTRSIKTVPVRALPFGAGVSGAESVDGFWSVEGGFIPHKQLIAHDDVEKDAAATALRFLGVPYLWGGDSNFGIDCSGLVHIALRMAGLDCPRDSDQQEVFFDAVPEGHGLRRNDLVFWKGHVGMMVDGETIVHANGHHMATTVEPLALVAQRILEAEGKEISRRARSILST